MATLKTLVVKDATTARDDILRTIKNGLIRQGVPTPNVGPSSDFYNVAEGLGNELAVIGANGIIATDAQMPDSATEADLLRGAGVFGLSPQTAAGSVGGVVILSTAIAPIATGAELTDSSGQRFAVTIGGNYANGATVPIAAISVGESTNHAAGDILTWSSAPPFCSDKVTVGLGGLINGADAEDGEALRARLLAKLQDPGTSANPAQVAEAVEASTGSVQKGFSYPAVQGPATCDAAATAAPTATNKSRQVASSIMAATVLPYAQGALPRQGELTVTTVVDTNADVAFALSIPDSPTANPPGAGGGWVNGTPWPTPDGVSTFRCTVTAVTSTVVVTVDATTSPTVNVARIAWLSPYDWTLYTAVVIGVTGVSGAYVVTLDKPLVGIATGCFIWPACQNAQLYVNAVLAQFALIGPGEKTANSGALVRGFRHPPPSVGWPYSLGPHLLHAITTAQSEVAAAQFYHRTDGVTTATGSSGQIVPQVPGSTASAPNIYVPRHIGFYRIAS
jgi:hypothetical protein